MSKNSFARADRRSEANHKIPFFYRHFATDLKIPGKQKMRQIPETSKWLRMAAARQPINRELATTTYATGAGTTASGKFDRGD